MRGCAIMKPQVSISGASQASPGFRSGWYFWASLRYAFFTSSADAPFLTPSVSYSVATYSSGGRATTTRAGRNTLSPSV